MAKLQEVDPEKRRAMEEARDEALKEATKAKK